MENKNKNYVNLSWLIFLVIGVVGIVLVRTLFEELNIGTVYDLNMNIYVYDVLILLYGFLSCGIVYNLGKLIVGLICGYEMVYFNLYLIGIKKIENKYKLYFGGEQDFSCKVVISPKKENVNIKMPLLGGTIACLIATALTYILIFALKATATVKFFFLVSSLFYFFIILLYLVPCRMDNLNDGFSLFLIKNKDSERVYLSNLKNMKALVDSSCPLTYLELLEVNDPLYLEAQVYNYYYLLEQGKIEEANELAVKYYEYRKNIINEDFSNMIVIGKVYSMYYNHQIEEFKKYYSTIDVNEKHIFDQGKKLEQIKTALFVAAYIDEDREEYAKIINSINNAQAKTKYPRIKEIETKLIKNMIKDISVTKPDINSL